MRHAKLTGGSRKGRPNQSTAVLKTMILGALDELGGQTWLVEQARHEPVAFMALLARLLPRQPVDTDMGALVPLEEMSDEQLNLIAGESPPMIEHEG